MCVALGRMIRAAAPVAAFIVVLGVSARARAIENEDCLACHSDKELSKTDAAGHPVSLTVDPARFASSIHAKNLCTSCHTDVTDLEHPENFRAKPVNCGQCHRVETDVYLSSDHGRAVHKGVVQPASCKDCHGTTHYLLNYRDPASPVYRANIPKTCDKCHGNTAEMDKFHLRQHSPIASYQTSVHGLALAKGKLNAAVCTDCHGSHDLHRSTNPASKLFYQRVPDTCGRCHENVEQTYLRSVHGTAVRAGVRDAPVCTDCHGEHSIQAVKLASSRVAPANIPKTCGQCHAAQRIIAQYRLPPNVFATYEQSFHGLALQGGNLSAANCSSCHGIHDILSARDPRSSIFPKNLPQTCGKCHTGIGTRLSAEFFRVHAPPGAAEGKPWIVNLISNFYLVLIVVTIGGMAAFNLVDYLRKARAHVRATRAGGGELRLTGWMRAQHFALMVLFLLLVYTGFVHKFPDAAFSWPFRALGETGARLRGLTHRVCGWTFVAFFLAHLAALVGTRAGRGHLRALWFGWTDVKDALAQLAHNLGLRRQAPPPRRWSYIEKSEYWALVWGSVVMSITGVLLIFTETVLRLLPKVWHDVAQVIHFYEALLAALAILVWHLYWVIFDPGEYPMSPAWLIGTKPTHASHESLPPPPPAEGKDEPAPPGSSPRG
jgi:cytochrome b subunit of formate dehydrogenase/DnaJ-class molecular chaperone